MDAYLHATGFRYIKAQGAVAKDSQPCIHARGCDSFYADVWLPFFDDVTLWRRSELFRRSLGKEIAPEDLMFHVPGAKSFD